MATTPTATEGAVYSYSDTADITSGLRQRVCKDIIYSTDPTDLPLRDYFGGYEKASVKSIKAEFPEDNHIAIDTTIGTAATGWNTGSDTSGLSVTDDDVLMVGDVLLTSDGEIVIVSATGTNTIDVYARGDLGSTESNANSNGDAIYIIGNAQLEGWTYGASPRFMTRTTKYNIVQNFEATISVSRDYQDVPKYGIKDEFKYQLKQNQLRIAKLLERAVIYGGLNIDTEEGSASQPRTMAGMLAPGSATSSIDIQTHAYDLSSVEIAESNLKTAMQDVFDDGGKVDTIICNSFNKGTISDWLQPYRRTDMEDKKYGGIVSTYDNDFGTCSIIVDRYMRQSDIILLAKKNFEIGAFEAFNVVDLPRTADALKASVIGKYTCFLYNEEHAAVITSTSTS